MSRLGMIVRFVVASALWTLVTTSCHPGFTESAGAEPPKSDIPTCGNGACDLGENCATCAEDCGACPSPCGDGVCGAGETCGTCPSDCGTCPPACGDGTCNGDETCDSCAEDCGACPFCGDGDCNGGETCHSCAQDCGVCPICGDGHCNGGETCKTCPGDCGVCPPKCGDGTCNGSETWDSCRGDCTTEPRLPWNAIASCATSSTVNDAGPNLPDYTWVDADTHKVIYDDGAGTGPQPLDGTYVDFATGRMSINGVHTADVACGASTSGCAFFWRNPNTNQYVDWYISNNSYYHADAQTWVPCP